VISVRRHPPLQQQPWSIHDSLETQSNQEFRRHHDDVKEGIVCADEVDVRSVARSVDRLRRVAIDRIRC
jgi:hypothetical protein